MCAGKSDRRGRALSQKFKTQVSSANEVLEKICFIFHTHLELQSLIMVQEELSSASSLNFDFLLTFLWLNLLQTVKK